MKVVSQGFLADVEIASSRYKGFQRHSGLIMVLIITMLTWMS